MTDGPQDQQTDPSWVAYRIARALGEDFDGAVASIRLVVTHLGAEFAERMLARTQEIEAAGGLPTNDGHRRRTPGGVYLHLVREAISDDQRRVVFPYGTKGGPPPAPAKPPMPWEERLVAFAEASRQPGEARNVKILITGRPGTPALRGSTVVLALDDKTLPALPRELVPPSASPPTRYVIHIAERHWRRVEDALRNPEDTLVVEGHCVLDAGTQAIAVYATNVTTKLLQRAEHERQQRKQEQQQSPAARSRSAPSKSRAPASPQPAPSSSSTAAASPKPPSTPDRPRRRLIVR